MGSDRSKSFSPKQTYRNASAIGITEDRFILIRVKSPLSWSLPESKPAMGLLEEKLWQNLSPETSLALTRKWKLMPTLLIQFA